ncbi:hypothetical protein [Pseudothauera rhizosphaerae]|uniref:Uncharacterized protein n=1 Tax=Pseudothauera rhizosphaerae TaxID=2565932 RepID=A0A4S4AYT1_9RHOO|nr:hypothetical protein [Pseudothauera rhizosphaerae]THF65270.1 hypothetical protein E6O51_01325 [Pseudothauera rhizosphaerae]
MDIQPVLDEIEKRHGAKRRPTRAQIQQVVATFGVAETIALTSLLVALYAYWNPPRARSELACQKHRPLRGRKCGESIVHKEFDKERNVLILICKAGHRTELKSQ